MYFVELYFENARKNKSGRFIIKPNRGSIPKWRILSSEKKNLEILRLITLATANPYLPPHLDFSMDDIMANAHKPLHLEFVIFHHPETDGNSKYEYSNVGSGVSLSYEGSVTALSRCHCSNLPPTVSYRKVRTYSAASKHFLLAYGPRFLPHDSTDDFEFNDPFYPITRFHTLFHADRKVTDPVAFLELLRHRGVKYKRSGSLAVITTLCDILGSCLDMDTRHFLDSQSDVAHEWRRMRPWQQRMALPLIDMCRHCYDAFPTAPNPLLRPGLILLNRPDLFCTGKALSLWIDQLNTMLPNMQFWATLSEKSAQRLPRKIVRQRLSLQGPAPRKQEKKKRAAPLPKRPVLLIDVDSRLPNLALMKLSRYYKEKGKDVVLGRRAYYLKNADRVYASTIFMSNASDRRVKTLKRYYGSSLKIGGSGVDLGLRLPKEVENMPADYSLYPELKDRAIGFITRGCPHRCPFCVVPEKEGPPRQVSSIGSLLEKNRKKLILLDDNILAHPRACEFLEELVSRNLQVNFTQTLDMRYVTKEKAELLRKIQCMNSRFTRPNHYFSLNNNKRMSLISRKYKMLGFRPSDNVEFVCMYGFNTTLREDLERFRFLRRLPGAYVFTQKYQPIQGGKEPCLNNFFSDDADELLDELVKIVFTQNMQNMENYYRWVSKFYAKTFNKLHKGLVDTIFRYNQRYRKGQYIATLAGTRKR